MLCQQVSQPLAPTVAGRNDAKQGLDHDGLGIKAHRVLQVGCQVPGGNRLDGVDAISQPLVVCGQVAHIRQCMQSRAEHGTVEAEGLGDRFLVLARQVFERLGNGAE